METQLLNETPSIATTKKKEPSILGSVFRTIFVETASDFFGGIRNFFARYGRHFFYCFKYLFHPSLRNQRLAQSDWKQNCQQAFELSILVSVLIFFLIKVNWIPVTDKALQETYGNDISQMLMNLMVFLVFALTYCLLCLFSIMAGRILRLVFSVATTKQETDILFIYLTNVIFSIAAVLALFFRCGVTAEMVDQMNVSASAMWASFVLLLFIPLEIWGYRFAKLNGLKGVRRIAFVVIIPFSLSIFYGFAVYMITLFLLGT